MPAYIITEPSGAQLLYTLSGTEQEAWDKLVERVGRDREYWMGKGYGCEAVRAYA